MSVSNVKPPSKWSMLFAGLLPLLAFSFIEEKYGPAWGTVAGMVFGLGEIIYEKVKFKKVSGITWIGNLLILFLGGISIFTADGVWFKLQPAIFELFFAVFLWGSVLLKKNFLWEMLKKQGFPADKPELIRKVDALTVRLGFFFLIHCVIATFAAFYWSTSAWVMLKGVGLTVSMMVYMLVEFYFLRKYFITARKNPSDHDSQGPQ